MPVNCIDVIGIVLACYFVNQFCCKVGSHPCYLFHLLSLGNKVVATGSRTNYFSLASGNSGNFSEVFSADRVNLIAGFSCVCAQFPVWKKKPAKCVQQLQHQHHGTDVLALECSTSLDCCRKQDLDSYLINSLCQSGISPSNALAFILLVLYHPSLLSHTRFWLSPERDFHQ